MRIRILAVVAVLLGATVTSRGVSITVDENGGGSISGSVVSVLGHDVLVYPLPGLVVPGDVVLTEPTRTTVAASSDLIRFADLPAVTGTPARGVLLFYSDRASAGERADLADVGVPDDRLPNLKTFEETGLFGQPYSDAGPNGLVYTPGANDPGFLVAADRTLTTPSVTYTIVSDVAPVPLPASAGAGLALIAGLAAWQGYQRRRRLAC